MRLLGYVFGILTVLLVLFLLVYVSVQFVHRLRTGEPRGKSLRRWLLDLWDIVSGF